MQMQCAKLCRLEESEKQTLGHFTLFQGADDIFQCKTLELPDKDNQKNISCIPKGRYKCVRSHSGRFGFVFKVMDLDGGHVNGRRYILIHFGNYYSQTLGCILVGKTHTDINGDGLRDVTSSKLTMTLLARLADDVFYLDIV